MPKLSSAIDTSADTFLSNAALNRGLADELRSRVAGAALGGPEASRARHVARGKLLPRERVERLLDPGAPFLRDRPAGGVRPLRRRGAGGGGDLRRRAGLGPRGGDRLQRPDGEGRRLFPHDGEEAPARPGDRPAEPPAVRLSGGQRRRQPAAPGGGVPRPRPLRPHLLQSGADVGAGHRPDRLRHGLLHRRRRLCAGHERRDGDREGLRSRKPGHHLPRRPAPGEGGDRRGDLRHRPWRRRHPWAQVRRGGSCGRQRRACVGDRPLHRRPARREGRGGRPTSASPARRSSILPSSTA